MSFVELRKSSNKTDDGYVAQERSFNISDGRKILAAATAELPQQLSVQEPLENVCRQVSERRCVSVSWLNEMSNYKTFVAANVTGREQHST